MKKSLLLIFLFSSLIFLSGCTSDQPLESAQQQDASLDQRASQPETTNTTTNDTYPPSTRSTTTSTTTKVTTPTPTPVVEPEPTQVVTSTQTIAPTPAPTPAPSYDIPSSSCCKICSKGKACGDSCISRSYTCHKGPGCACDG